MTPKDFNLRVFEGIYMKNTIIVPMLGMFFLSGFYMQASSSEKKQSKSILNRLDNTVPLVGNASSNTTSSIYGMVSSRQYVHMILGISFEVNCSCCLTHTSQRTRTMMMSIRMIHHTISTQGVEKFPIRRGMAQLL